MKKLLFLSAPAVARKDMKNSAVKVRMQAMREIVANMKEFIISP
jgi:hypothetical protein